MTTAPLFQVLVYRHRDGKLDDCKLVAAFARRSEGSDYAREQSYAKRTMYSVARNADHVTLDTFKDGEEVVS